jgi:hypothetical protein
MRVAVWEQGSNAGVVGPRLVFTGGHTIRARETGGRRGGVRVR